MPEDVEDVPKSSPRFRGKLSKKAREIAGKIAEGSRKVVDKVTEASQKVSDGTSDEEIPMEAQDVEDILKIIHEKSEDDSEEEAKPSSLWENVDSGSKRVEERARQDLADDQYWLNQIEDIFDKYLIAEEANDTRLMQSYLSLLGELARRTKNEALQKYIQTKTARLLTGPTEL